MPHVIVEYSANIEAEISPQRLVEEIHGAAITSGIAEPVAIRTRLMRREDFRVGDGAPENAFVHIDIRARKGRTLEQKKAMVQETEKPGVSVQLRRRHGIAASLLFRWRVGFGVTDDAASNVTTDQWNYTYRTDWTTKGNGTRWITTQDDASGIKIWGRGTLDGKPDAGRRDVRGHSPIDNRHRQGRAAAAEIGAAKAATKRSAPAGADHRRGAQENPAQNRRRDRGARRRDRARRVGRYRPADPLYVEGGRARRGEFPLLCGPRAERQ